MKLYRRKNGIYYFDLRSEGGGYVSLGTKDKKTAQEISTQKLQNKFNVRLSKASAPNLSDLIERCLDYWENRIKTRMMDRITTCVRKLLAFFDPSIRIKDFKPEMSKKINNSGFLRDIAPPQLTLIPPL